MCRSAAEGLPCEAGRQRADDLLLLQIARGGVVVEDVDGAVELADDIHELAARVVHEVARAGLRPGFGSRRHGGCQPAGRRVERELVDAVVAESRHQHETIRGIGEDRVRVGIVLQHLLRRRHFSGRPDRIHGDPVAGIGRAQEEAARAVDRDVGQAVGERPARDVLQLAARRIDREAGRGLRLAARADVEDAAIGAHRHRRRDARLLDAGDRRLVDDREVAVLRVELEHVDLIALGVADIDEGGGRGR